MLNGRVVRPVLDDGHLGDSEEMIRHRFLLVRPCGPITFSDISFGMCLNLMSWVQQVHNAAVVAARSLGCQCDTEIPGYPAYPGRLFYFRAAAARRLRVAVAVSFWAPSRSEATKAAAVTGGVRLGEELP